MILADGSKLPPGDCVGGYTVEQVEHVLATHLRSPEEFWKWMYGQTMMLCDGRKFNHDTQEYEEACGGVAHGTIVYRWDMAGFLDNMPVTD